MEQIHEVFKPWVEKIFTNDPTTLKEIKKQLKELEVEDGEKRKSFDK